MTAALRIENLRKQYGGVRAVDSLSFHVDPGEVVGLLGPNGAGKTTTVECILGLRAPDAGRVEISGVDMQQHPRAAKDRLGASLQMTGLHDKITAREALALFGSFYSRTIPAADLLERFSLADKADSPVAALSAGQRQRLALALAFVNAPDVVCLDEPTAGLDAHARRALQAEIVRARGDGVAVLLTTHLIDEASAVCDRVCVIDRGRLLATGTPADIVSRSTSVPLVTVLADRPIPVGVGQELTGASDVHLADAALTFRSADSSRAVRELLARLEHAGIEVLELHVQRTKLEEVFLELTTTGDD